MQQCVSVRGCKPDSAKVVRERALAVGSGLRALNGALRSTLDSVGDSDHNDDDDAAAAAADDAQQWAVISRRAPIGWPSGTASLSITSAPHHRRPLLLLLLHGPATSTVHRGTRFTARGVN